METQITTTEEKSYETEYIIRVKTKKELTKNEKLIFLVNLKYRLQGCYTETPNSVKDANMSLELSNTKNKTMTNTTKETQRLEEKIQAIAKACHEANKVWCEANGDNSQKHWDEAEGWQRDSAINGVKFRLENPNAKEDTQHNAWMEDKTKDGWIFGEIKDAYEKTHPCLVPFNELPLFQQKKDRLFCAIVDALK